MNPRRPYPRAALNRGSLLSSLGMHGVVLGAALAGGFIGSQGSSGSAPRAPRAIEVRVARPERPPPPEAEPELVEAQAPEEPRIELPQFEPPEPEVLPETRVIEAWPHPRPRYEPRVDLARLMRPRRAKPRRPKTAVTRAPSIGVPARDPLPRPASVPAPEPPPPDRDPEPLAGDCKAPSYPSRAARLGLVGRVRLLVSVSSTGAVERVSIHESSGHPVLDRAARHAVESWRFRPARRAGREVAEEVVVPIRFGPG